MNWTDVLDILKYVLPSLITFLTAYVVLKLFLSGEKDRKELEVRADHYKDALPIRLGAYERLTILLERISPTNLLQRVNKPGMTALDFAASNGSKKAAKVLRSLARGDQLTLCIQKHEQKTKVHHHHRPTGIGKNHSC